MSCTLSWNSCIHSYSGFIFCLVDSRDDCHLIILVEWICWLNGQRKKAPTAEVHQYEKKFFAFVGSPSRDP